MLLARRILPLLALALVLAVFVARPAQAQTPALELTDFDETGLEVLVKMLVTAGSSELYRSTASTNGDGVCP